MIEIAPSLMCADFAHLADEVSELEQAGAHHFHIDIMDGNFAPNFAMGLNDLMATRAATSLPLEVHLMVAHPEDSFRIFCEAGCDRLIVHAETTPNIHRVLASIRSLGVNPGIAINPGTPINVLEDLLDDVDLVLLMSVDPGFAGQTFIERTVLKAQNLQNLIGGRPVTVEVDGHVNRDTIRRLVPNGVTSFVAGTAGLFTKDGPEAYQANMSALREAGDSVLSS